MLRVAIPLVVAVTLACSARAEERDAALLNGLRRLQLFDLAEKYCRRELNEQANSQEREAELTIELIRTLALSAMSRPPDEREPLWQQAREAAADFERTKADHPLLLLVRVQDALTLLAQGELAQQEAEAKTDDPAALSAAAEQLRQAAKALGEVQRAIAREIPLRRRQSPREEELSADELVRLDLNVSLHLAKAQRLQARCYPANSADRKALLLATLDAIGAAVSRLDATDDLAGRLRVLQMECLRELGRLSDAEKLWPLVEREEMPLDIRRDALAEMARLLVAADRPADAIALLDHEKFAALTSASHPQLDVARLEAALAAAQSTKGTEQSKWQKTAAALAQQIDQQHGRAWGRRADQLVAALVPQNAAGGNVDLLARVADSLYLKRQFDEAVAAYDKAAAAAGDTQREFELRYKGALVEQQRKNYAAASSRLERVAIGLKTHPQAAEAHLLACWNKAQQAREEEAARSAYVQLVEEHIARWPESPTADQARLWLGQWHEAQQAWTKAYAAYAAIAADAQQFPQALAAAAKCARQELASSKGTEEETARTARDRVTWFESIARQRNEQKHATDAARQAALVAAELALEYVPASQSSVEKLLRDTIAASPEPDDAWRSEATALLVAAVAAQPGRRDEAQRLLQSLSTNHDQLLALLDRLAGTAERAGPRLKADLAALELEVIERLSKAAAALSAQQRLELDRLRASALAQLGRRDEALAAYAALAKAQPNHGAVQETYAELLSDSSDKETLTAALSRWRQIAARSEPRGERWCKAKYQVAAIQCKLGDRAAAATLCRYLLETPPGLSETGWQERFEKLLAECEK